MPPLQAACIAFVFAAFGDPVDFEYLDRKGEYTKLSETVRALITEAMNMERLATSVKKGVGGKSQAAGKTKKK